MNNGSQSQRACRYLGLIDDATTSSAFPSTSNFCHHSDPIAAPRFKHQEEFCLTGKHGQCPLFLNPQAMPLPQVLRIPPIVQNNSNRNLVIGLTVFVTLLVLGWAVMRQNPSAPEIETATWTVPPSALPTSTVISQPLISIMATDTLIIAPTLTQTPNGTATPTITHTVTPSKHQYDVLIGTDYQFVIHIVKAGENLDLLAVKYKTSEDAIVTINYFQSNPGWSGTQLVIPVGFTDVSKLPSFIVYQVQEKDRGSSIDDLAKRLKVTALDLKFYNGWTNPGDRPIVGDLILVPRRRPMN